MQVLATHAAGVLPGDIMPHRPANSQRQAPVSATTTCIPSGAVARVSSPVLKPVQRGDHHRVVESDAWGDVTVEGSVLGGSLIARWLWRAYAAADEEYESADRRLLTTDYGPAVVGALASGPEADAALEFLSVHRPIEVVDQCLDVLLPLAIEGGSEQGDVRQLVFAADRSAVSDALPGLVARVISGPDEGDAAYLAYYGLMDLLERLDERQLLRYVVRAARQSPDPEVHSAADDFDDESGALEEQAGVPATARAHSSRRESPTPEAAQAWQDFVRARSRRNTARNELLRRGSVTAVSPQLRSGARLLAEVLGSETYTEDIHDVLRSLDTASLRQAARLIADTLLTDHRLRAERYRALLTLLTDLTDTAGLTVALERARSCTDPEVRRLAG